MTEREALMEAKRRWGADGAVRVRGPSLKRPPGRLARYRYMVGNGRLGTGCSIIGHGNSWGEAFEDARPRPERARESAG